MPQHGVVLDGSTGPKRNADVLPQRVTAVFDRGVLSSEVKRLRYSTVFLGDVGIQEKEILEGLVLLPPVRTEISRVCRQDPAMAEMLGQDNE